jgi:hypothetical protein
MEIGLCMFLYGIQVLLGWFIADVLSGIFHCLGDRYKWFGPLHIAFVEHHNNPEVREDGLLWLLWLPMIGSIPLWVLGILGQVYDIWILSPWVWIPGAIGICMAQYTHRYSHHPGMTWGWVRFLQRLHIILPPSEHAKHHRGNNRQGYCVVNGWGNVIVDRLGRVIA